MKAKALQNDLGKQRMRNCLHDFCGLALKELVLVLVVVVFSTSLEAQERRPKLRISNAGFTITALPLLAAKDWGLFTANGLDMEVILMQSALVRAALTQGDIDYQAGVGPASVNAIMSGCLHLVICIS